MQILRKLHWFCLDTVTGKCLVHHVVVTGIFLLYIVLGAVKVYFSSCHGGGGILLTVCLLNLDHMAK